MLPPNKPTRNPFLICFLLAVINPSLKATEGEIIPHAYQAYQDQRFCDFSIIASDNKEFKCHRLLLFAKPFFNHLLNSGMQESVEGRLYLPYSSGTIQTLLESFYLPGKKEELINNFDDPSKLMKLIELAHFIGEKELLKVINLRLSKLFRESPILDKVYNNIAFSLVYRLPEFLNENLLHLHNLNPEPEEITQWEALVKEILSNQIQPLEQKFIEKLTKTPFGQNLLETLFSEWNTCIPENSDSRHNYAYMLNSGIGVARNNEQARLLFWQNWQENQNNDSLLNYSIMLSSGIGGPKDEGQALNLHKQNWELNHNSSALHGYAYMLAHGPIETRDEAQARLLYKKNWDENRHSTSLNCYAYLLEHGIGGPEDREQARRLYKQNWNDNRQGDSLNNYAFMLYKGLGGPKDMEQARRLFKKNWDESQKPCSLYFYAVMLWNGQGGPQNQAEARRLLTLNWETNQHEASRKLLSEHP